MSSNLKGYRNVIGYECDKFTANLNLTICIYSKSSVELASNNDIE